MFGENCKLPITKAPGLESAEKIAFARPPSFCPGTEIPPPQSVGGMEQCALTLSTEVIYAKSSATLNLLEMIRNIADFELTSRVIFVFTASVTTALSEAF